MKTYLTIAAAVLSLIVVPNIWAHCQIPCGIYSDDTVLKDLHTDQETIEKSMQAIIELSKDAAGNAGGNANQLIRWVVNKDEHASKIQNIMQDYFLAQRLKLEEMESDKEAYLEKLTLSHKIIVLAMKCKQSTDLAVAKDLHEAIASFTLAYTKKK